MSSDSEIDSSDTEDESSSNKQVFNVVIFGASGAGKSAIINQVYDKFVVESSDQAVGCTMENAKVSGRIKDYPHLTLNLYDTAGLAESTEGNVPTATAFVQLIKLSYAIPNGINLLICCHPKGRIGTEQFKANYRIFKEDLCENRIPCLLVITNCDNDQPIDSWWVNNEDIVRNQLKLKFIDAICVSTLKSTTRNPDKILENYLVSRSNLIEAIRKNALRKPVSIDSWKRKAMIYVRTFYNILARWTAWLGFQQQALRPELEQMFIELKYSPAEAKIETEKLLKELETKDLMEPYQEINV